ncbi:MAG: phage terminase large subunit [Patescibacteria group bacterium]
MKVKFEVHESHIPVFENNPDIRYYIFMGGRGNGRSGTASRAVVTKLLGKEYVRGAMMRAVREDIRASCWGEVIDRINEQKISSSFRIVDNDMFLERGQNSFKAMGFRASSGSLTARLKSLAGFNMVWIEEGEETVEEEFRKLDDTLRTVKGRIIIIITLNTPPVNHWILKKWFNMIPVEGVQGFYRPELKPEIKDVVYIPGTYKENEVNMDRHTIDRYEHYKDTNPAYYYQVIKGYSPEEVRGKIYTGWQIIDAVPLEARLVKFGEDFGWYPDPACAVAVYYWNGSYIIDELAYGNFLTNEYLAGEIKTVDPHKIITTIADSAEPKSIAEQNKYGIKVVGAEKGKDSVSFRIKVTSQKKIYVTRRSTKVWESYENYAWAEDKDGNPTGEPDHTYSHAMDAVSYAIASMHNKTVDKPPVQASREKTNPGV